MLDTIHLGLGGLESDNQSQPGTTQTREEAQNAKEIDDHEDFKDIDEEAQE